MSQDRSHQSRYPLNISNAKPSSVFCPSFSGVSSHGKGDDVLTVGGTMSRVSSDNYILSTRCCSFSAVVEAIFSQG